MFRTMFVPMSWDNFGSRRLNSPSPRIFKVNRGMCPADTMHFLRQKCNPYSCPSKEMRRKAKPGQWVRTLDMSGYQPESINVKVRDGEVYVTAFKERRSPSGFKSYTETTRRFTIPAGVDADKLKCFLRKDGRLALKAPLAKMLQDSNGEGKHLQHECADRKAEKKQVTYTEEPTTSPDSLKEIAMEMIQASQVKPCEERNEQSESNVEEDCAEEVIYVDADDHEKSMDREINAETVDVDGNENSVDNEINADTVDFDDDSSNGDHELTPETVCVGDTDDNVDHVLTEETDVSPVETPIIEHPDDIETRTESADDCQIIPEPQQPMPTSDLEIAENQDTDPTKPFIATKIVAQVNDTSVAVHKPFVFEVNLGDFPVDCVKLRCRDSMLHVDAVHETRTDHGYSRHELHRAVTLPKDADYTLARAAVTSEGKLTVTVPRRQDEERTLKIELLHE